MKVWDLHCDTLYELRRAEKAGAPKSFLHNDLHIDLEKLRQGDYLLQCFAAYVDLADPAPGADPLVSVLEEIDIFKRLMAAYPEKIAPVYTAADLERNRAEGKLSAMLTVEEGGCCKGSLGVLRRLQELGVRKDGTRQSIAEMEIFPAEYFCPMAFPTRELRVTPKTYSIHRYAESWKPKPSAALVSSSKVREASFSCNFSSASFRSGYLAPSAG